MHNMAKLSKEATTFRRVFESILRYFDQYNLWPSRKGLALPVLLEMQLQLYEESVASNPSNAPYVPNSSNSGKICNSCFLIPFMHHFLLFKVQEKNICLFFLFFFILMLSVL